MSDILREIAKAPATQLDPEMAKEVKALIGKPDAEVKVGLHQILDKCAHGSLASDFTMLILDGEWKRLGGKSDDPAPWRK